MNIINNYLDSMFAPYPMTPRLLEAKEELRQMMEDAYYAALSQGLSENAAVGKVITEFGDLDEVAPVLGISAELNSSPAGSDGLRAAVTMGEAQSYSEAIRRTQKQLAVAVSVLVMSPATLVMLTLLPIDEVISTVVGLTVLLVLVAVGVSLLVQRDGVLAPYKRISDGEFLTDPAVSSWAIAQSQANDTARRRALTAAIAVWILAALPTILAGLLWERLQVVEAWIGVGVVCTLLMVAMGLCIFLPANWAHSVKETLLKEDSEDEYTMTSSPLGAAILGAYWPLVVAIYLGWSFWSGDWHITWIVWPVAGVLYAAVAAFITAIRPANR